MQICPECHGKKILEIPSPNLLHVYLEGPCITEVYTCETCEGFGQIQDLEMAIYLARGEEKPPPDVTGYA